MRLKCVKIAHLLNSLVNNIVTQYASVFVLRHCQPLQLLCLAVVCRYCENKLLHLCTYVLPSSNHVHPVHLSVCPPTPASGSIALTGCKLLKTLPSAAAATGRFLACPSCCRQHHHKCSSVCHSVFMTLTDITAESNAEGRDRLP